MNEKHSNPRHGLIHLILHGLIASGDIELYPGRYSQVCQDHRPHCPPKNGKNITSILCNAQSIRNKGQQLLSHLLANTLPDILFFTETWLSSHDNESILGLPDNYVIMRKDRHHGRHGSGIMAAVNASLVPCRLDHLEHGDINLMWIYVSLSNESWLICILNHLSS